MNERSRLPSTEGSRGTAEMRREAVIGDATYLENAPTTMPLELPEVVDGDVRSDCPGDVA